MTQIISQHISENWLSREEMTAYFRVKTGMSLFFSISSLISAIILGQCANFKTLYWSGNGIFVKKFQPVFMLNIIPKFMDLTGIHRHLMAC